MSNSEKSILIIDPCILPLPVKGYGGIERATELLYNYMLERGIRVEIVANIESEITHLSYPKFLISDLSEYTHIYSFNYQEEVLNKLKNFKQKVKIIFCNNVKPKYSLFKNFDFHYTTLSQAHHKRLKEVLDINSKIAPLFINTDKYINKNLNRDLDIAFIGAIGMQKSPLSCLRFAKKHNLSISFYGPHCFIDEEREYEQIFWNELKQYPKGKYYGETKSNDQKIDILNNHKYFIFIPGYDKQSWTEPFGIAGVEAISCGCTLITDFNSSHGYLEYANPSNSISIFSKSIKPKDPFQVSETIKSFDYRNIIDKFYV